MAMAKFSAYLPSKILSLANTVWLRRTVAHLSWITFNEIAFKMYGHMRFSNYLFIGLMSFFISLEFYQAVYKMLLLVKLSL